MWPRDPAAEGRGRWWERKRGTDLIQEMTRELNTEASSTKYV